MHVHVVVMNVAVGLASAHWIDASVLANKVLASSHWSTNECPVVVELVDVVELRADLRRQLLTNIRCHGGCGLLDRLLVVVHVGSKLFLELFSDLTLLVRGFLDVQRPVVLS